MKRIINLCFLLACCGTVYEGKAQTIVSDTNKNIKPIAPVKKVVVKKPKPIRTEFSGGIRLNTDGFGIFVDKGWVKSEEKMRDYFYDLKFVQVELEEKKHPKEIKRNNTSAIADEKSRPFIFGKLNNFYALKIGYGMRKMIAGKPEHGTVSIHWVYLGGLSVGMAKPYYYNIAGGAPIKFTDSTRDIFLRSPQTIEGSAGFAKGLNELKIIPGIHAKTGLHFDFATSNTTVLSMETGVNAELYMKNIELMALQKAVPYFVNIYASFQFGKRWQ